MKPTTEVLSGTRSIHIPMPTRFKLLWLALLLLAMVPRSVPLLSSLDHLVTTVPDDAFYYLETAQRIVDGQGATFDGNDIADGFQPLWMLLLLPFASLSPLAFLKATLGLGIALHLVAAGLLGRFVFLVAQSHSAALLAAAIYTTNTWATFSSVSGLETALTSALFCTALVLVTQFQQQDLEKRERWRWALAIAAAIAALFLARTDQIFYAGAFLLTTLFAARRKFVWTARVATVGVACAGPWLLWHWWQTGALVPSSGVAQPLIMRTLAELDGQSLTLAGWTSLRGFFDGRIFSFTGFNRYLLVPLMMLGGGVVLTRWRHLAPRIQLALRLIAMLAFAGFWLAFVHTFIRWYPRTWYFDQYILLIAAFLALSASILIHWATPLTQQRTHLRRALTAVISIGVLVFTISRVQASLQHRTALANGLYAAQAYTMDAARWFDQNLAPQEVVAAWNSGVVAFLSERPVVNLDGAISASTLSYLERRDLTSLLCDRRVSFIADVVPDFDRFQPFLPGYERYAVETPTVFSHRDVWADYRLQQVSLGASGACNETTQSPSRP